MAKFNLCFIVASLHVLILHAKTFVGYLYPSDELQKFVVDQKTTKEIFKNSKKIIFYHLEPNIRRI